MAKLTRIPLDIVVTATGERTADKIVAVLVDELDALEKENARMSRRLSTTLTFIMEVARKEHRDEVGNLGAVARNIMEGP